MTMTAEHFNEVFFMVLLTTHSNKWRLARHLNISMVTLNKYLKDGVPLSKQFLIMDRLEVYLFANLGGSDCGVDRQTV
jgi:hypothetical protein